MGCAEVGSATWLLVATKLGFPVSTTQTVVGAIVGAGIASQAQVTWRWTDGSVSQVAASWGIAPALSACFSAILFGTLKFYILERENSFEKALRAIPIYLAFTAAVLALFITIEAPNAHRLRFLLGAGFWFMGHHIIKALGNKITQVSPTRGYAMELGAAITVLLASRLGLPVSTTQCLTGAVCGVALMNADLGAVNWRQLAWIIGGWVLTLPSAGLIAGLLTVMALNAPQFR
ncbi:hypothetical protein FNYG_15905 [Fusarium nygamai]|uniref:Phosphate transporter n=1 Tax=Gibberella nygamai TaxID=42673 RepID=A0A2K0U0I5_GIBNY|nr:hypothetical protein FNYG_15905 [Fusarium nygamai]